MSTTLRRSIRALAFVLALASATPALAAPFTYPAPVMQTFPTPAPPGVTAAAWILYDESTDTVIALQPGSWQYHTGMRCPHHS